MRGLSRFRFVVAWALVALPAAASIQLDIPPRRQWDNKHGYCGECTIQQIALYYGTYISQYRARAIIDPTQEQDVWVPENSGPILEALRLRYEEWDSGRPTPQYQAYLVWAKAHLAQGHAVIIDVFVQGGSEPTYDHIIPAIGFGSVDTTAYHASDTLVFNDNYETEPYVRTFGSLYDTRAMNGNGRTYEYCIPRDTDYGCAVMGIDDGSGMALPVSLKVNRWDEPNISRGAQPAQMTATIEVRGLVPGAPYALLRYDDYRTVPTDNYLASAFSASTVFTATGSVQQFSDRFMSDSITVYRCVPLGVPRPSITALERVAGGVRIRFTSQPGWRYDVDWCSDPTSGTWWNLARNVTATGSTLAVTDPGALNQPRRFYRVGAVPP